MCEAYPAWWRASTRASAWISSASAYPPGAVKSPDERPHAPAASASSSSIAIVARSAAVSGRFSMPAAINRSV